MKRKSPDVPLQANDILYIPDNNGQRLTAETFDRLAGLGTATATDSSSGTKTGAMRKEEIAIPNEEG